MFDFDLRAISSVAIEQGLIEVIGIHTVTHGGLNLITLLFKLVSQILSDGLGGLLRLHFRHLLMKVPRFHHGG